MRLTEIIVSAPVFGVGPEDELEAGAPHVADAHR